MDTSETPPNGSETPSETPAATDRNSFDLSVCDLRKKRLSVREIARHLACSPAKVHRSMNRTVDRFADEMGLRHLSREEIQSRIFGFAPRAAQQIQHLATSAKKEEVQLKASADMLDRAGFSPVQRSLNYCSRCAPIEEMSHEELLAGIESLAQAVQARLRQSEEVENKFDRNIK